MPIRILHVVTYMGRGGLETMIMNYYRHMDRAKVQFDFLVHREFTADYDGEIEQLGGKIFRLPKLNPWSAEYRRALDQFWKEHPEYRIVHVHQDCLSSIALKSAKENGVPIRIAHSHSSSQDKNIKYIIKLWYKRQIPQYATHLFACSKEAGDWMFDGTAYSIVNNAIDTNSYVFDREKALSIRNNLGISSDALVLGHVGRFAQVKNHAFLINILAQISKMRDRVYLLLVGDGELKGVIEEKVQELGLSEQVIFTGVRKDIPEVLQAMDVFVFPSLYEGLPVSLVEAQAAGLPCLVSDTISDECMITDLIQKASLNETAHAWAIKALTMAKRERCNMYSEIAGRGFDIVQNAAKLQEFYLDQWETQKRWQH